MLGRQIRYDEIEEDINRLSSGLKGSYPISKRAVALLFLQGDEEVEGWVRSQGDEDFALRIREEVKGKYAYPLSYIIGLKRQREAQRLSSQAIIIKREVRRDFAEGLSQLMMHPLTGWVFILICLLGLYYFVGVFGAGILVGYIEGFFEEEINPWFRDIVAFIPLASLRELLAGEYGVITLGFRYALAIILPIVATFFIVFSIIEDTGYLPRLAMFFDRIFKIIGLSGRAIIPTVLGFGCVTMATLTTRTLETNRERLISTFLLALAIPCSAQLGVIFAILSPYPSFLLLWGGIVASVFLVMGFLLSRLLPGSKPSFFMEIPPLRLPQPSNILSKTWARLRWYFIEVLPLFLIASFLIWLGKITGVFDSLLRGLEPIMRFAGLPPDTAVVFLYGFFRRDYGAAGLYDLQSEGILIGLPLLIAGVILTLFIPCIANLMMIIRERGIGVALAIFLFIFPFAFSIGSLLYRFFSFLGF